MLCVSHSASAHTFSGFQSAVKAGSFQHALRSRRCRLPPTQLKLSHTHTHSKPVCHERQCLLHQRGRAEGTHLGINSSIAIAYVGPLEDPCAGGRRLSAQLSCKTRYARWWFDSASMHHGVACNQQAYGRLFTLYSSTQLTAVPFAWCLPGVDTEKRRRVYAAPSSLDLAVALLQELVMCSGVVQRTEHEKPAAVELDGMLTSLRPLAKCARLTGQVAQGSRENVARQIKSTPRPGSSLVAPRLAHLLPRLDGCWPGLDRGRLIAAAQGASPAPHAHPEPFAGYRFSPLPIGTYIARSPPRTLHGAETAKRER
jgi:hypothetical protein